MRSAIPSMLKSIHFILAPLRIRVGGFRDSLRMCRSVQNVSTYTPELKPGYSATRLSDATTDEWVGLLAKAGIAVTMQTWKEDFSTSGGAAFGILHGSHLVGTAGIRPVSEDFSLLTWVAVDPRYQGQKLARTLVALAMREALSTDTKMVFLVTDDSRLAAIKTYIALAFRPCLSSWDSTHYYRWKQISRKLKITPTMCTGHSKLQSRQSPRTK